MSEPNDTAQEGFDQLKRNLEVRYPEDSDLSLDELYNFLKFSYTRQQHYLPNSLIGNIFGMKLGGHLAAVSFPLHGAHSPSM